MMGARRWLPGLLLVLLWPAAASAGGGEYSGVGARSLGRGGAVTARADDPMVLMYNPAGLAELQGSSLMFNLNLALLTACVQPAGDYGWGADDGGPSMLTAPGGEVQRLDLGDPALDYHLDPLDEVCIKAHHTPIPELLWSRRVSKTIGIGFGLLLPAIEPSGSWGGRDGVIRGDDGELRPAPTRYMLLRSETIGLYPTFGIGAQLTRYLRVGLALQLGVVNMGITRVISARGGTSPDSDVVTQLRATDPLVPGVTVSVHLVPFEALDVVAAFKWQGDIDATGTMEFRTNQFARSDPDDPGSPAVHVTELEVASVRQALPERLAFGLRYASRLYPRSYGHGINRRVGADPRHIRDPLQDERWDLELDVEYFFTSAVKDTVIEIEPGQTVDFATNAGSRTAVPYPAEGQGEIVIERRWSDQIALRLGGSYNPLPGRLGLSAGVHYETRGANPKYMSVDAWPLERVGVHVGVVVRIAEAIDLIASYAHIFQETLVVAPPANAGDGSAAPDGTAALEQTVLDPSSGREPSITNAGTYRSDFDIMAVGIQVHY